MEIAVKSEPENAATYFSLRDALHTNGQLTDAFVAGVSGEALVHRSAKEMFQLGTTLFLDQKYDEATRWYRLAKKFDPEATVIWHRNLSINLWGQGRFCEAQFHRDQAFRRQCIFIERATDSRLWPSSCRSLN